MGALREMEIAALNHKIRADRSERLREDGHHALNLLINESVEWFCVINDSGGKEHKFGIGVVTNQPITDPFRLIASKGNTEDRAIVFWLTIHELEDGRTGKYLTTCSLEDFKTVPRELEQEHEPGWEHLVDLVNTALKLIDGAHREYLERRCGMKVM